MDIWMSWCHASAWNGKQTRYIITKELIALSDHCYGHLPIWLKLDPSALCPACALQDWTGLQLSWWDICRIAHVIINGLGSAYQSMQIPSVTGDSADLAFTCFYMMFQYVWEILIILTLRTAVQAASSSNFMWLLDFNFLKTWELSSRAIFGFKQPPSTLWRKNNKTAGSNDVDPPFTTIQHFTTIHTTARTNLSLSEKPFETFIQRSLLCPSPRSCRGAPSGENHHLLLGL